VVKCTIKGYCIVEYLLYPCSLQGEQQGIIIGLVSGGKITAWTKWPIHKFGWSFLKLHGHKTGVLSCAVQSTSLIKRVWKQTDVCPQPAFSGHVPGFQKLFSIYVCLYICLSFCTHMSKIYKEKAACVQKIEGCTDR